MNENEVYRLAILAAQLNPELCKTNPTQAISDAHRLMYHVRRFYRTPEEKQCDEEMEAKTEALHTTPVTYNEFVMLITGEGKKKHPHLSRAKVRFVEFWAFSNGITVAESKQQLREYENGKKSFVWSHPINNIEKYELWESQPKKRKGKQGRRISENDGRVKVGGVRIVEAVPELRRLLAS